MEPKEVWQARWDSLEQRLSTLIQRYNDPRFVFPHAVTAYNLVRCLQGFARKYFEWFRDGNFLQPTGTGYFLLPLEDTNNNTMCGYSEDYAFNAILAQVGQDIDIIEDAAESRLSAIQSATQTELNILARADGLAMKALQPAIDIKWFDHLNPRPTVLTYFDKRQSIRVVPYANVALVGIPRTVLQTPRDFLAIAHEVGHYVYWHGKRGDERIVDVVEKTLKPYIAANSPEDKVVKNWAEEMFADAYGAAIGGPVMAIDFQDIANREPEKDFFKDDVDHPTPVIRPGLYSKIEELRNRNNEGTTISSKLDERWSIRRSERVDKMSGHQDIQTENSAKPNIGATKDKLKEIIQQVYWPLVGGLQTWLLGVTDQPAKANDLEDLYTQFTTAANNFDPKDIANKVDDLPTPTDTECDRIWEDWILKREKFFDSVNDLYAITIYAGKPTDSNSKNVWLPVLIARGWTTEGPNSQWKK